MSRKDAKLAKKTKHMDLKLGLKDSLCGLA